MAGVRGVDGTKLGGGLGFGAKFAVAVGIGMGYGMTWPRRLD
jgi:hypothetical protein